MMIPILMILTLNVFANEGKAVPERYAFYKKLHDRLMTGEERKKLEDAIPRLDGKMDEALRTSMQRWSWSVNYDEFMKAEILDKTVLKGLKIPFEEKAGVLHVPAGVMHTYGYLFSQLMTKFGLKGKRWIESRVDERMGLEAGAFSPFGNVEFLTALTKALDDALAKKNKNTPVVGCLEEDVMWKTDRDDHESAELKTCFLKLKTLKDLDTKDTMLLVYSIKMEGAKEKYVTAFPVEQAFADAIIATKATKGKAFKPRYNLYIDPDWTVESYETEGFEEN